MKYILHISTAVFLLFILAVPGIGIDMFPMAVGNRWEYETVRVQNALIKIGEVPGTSIREAQSGNMVYSVTGTPGASVFDYQELTSLTDNRGKTQTDKTNIKFGVNNKGYYIQSTSSQTESETVPTEQVYSPPLFYFAKNANENKSWDVGVFKDRKLTEAFKARGNGRENITVPAGTFNNCLKVVYTSDGATGTFEASGVTFTPTGGKSVSIYWIAEGVGIVKELEVSSTKAEAKGPGGIKVVMESSACTISELKPGYTVAKSAEKSGK